MQNLMIFEGHDVEVFELNGQVLFNPYHVAEILDIKNVRDNIARMNAKQVVKLTNSKVGKTDFRKLHNTGENFLTESGVYKLVFKSHKPNAEAFTMYLESTPASCKASLMFFTIMFTEGSFSFFGLSCMIKQ